MRVVILLWLIGAYHTVKELKLEFFYPKHCTAFLLYYKESTSAGRYPFGKVNGAKFLSKISANHQTSQMTSVLPADSFRLSDGFVFPPSEEPLLLPFVLVTQHEIQLLESKPIQHLKFTVTGEEARMK